MPGAGKQPPEIQEHIKELLEAGFDPTTIHRRLKVGRSSIYRMKRCLQQHGTAYMPVELNKKNGRPKVLSAEQELEVRDWLRKPENRGRYLDDLVWLIHDRFGIVCSTTTMSKMKRKWLRVIEFEETGKRLDQTTYHSLLEIHPDLDILQQPGAIPQQNDGLAQQQALPGALGGLPMPGAPMAEMARPMHTPETAMHPALQAPGTHLEVDVPIEQQINAQLEAEIQGEISGADSRL